MELYTVEKDTYLFILYGYGLNGMEFCSTYVTPKGNCVYTIANGSSVSVHSVVFITFNIAVRIKSWYELQKVLYVQV